MNVERSDLTDDGILNGRIRLLQPKRGHRFGHDAILLAAATPARPGNRVIELGAGVGAASLALMARIPGLDVTLLDIDPDLTALASENIARNGLAGHARAITLDVVAPDHAFMDAGLVPGGFDQVLMNPPFNDASLQASPEAARRQAHAATGETLHLWVQRAAYLLRQSGGLCLIWRAEGQPQVLTELAAAFGDITILPVLPAPDQLPIRILVQARKSAAPSFQILPPLTLADRDRRPSAAAEAVLRGGMSLPLLGLQEETI